MFQIKVVERIKTQILCSVTFFFKKHANYQMMWKIIVEPDRPQMTVWSIHIAHWLHTATKTHSEYVTVFAFPWQQWLLECVSLLHLRVCCLSYCIECRFFRIECSLVSFVFWKFLNLNVVYFLITESYRESKFYICFLLIVNIDIYFMC
jgi:hypothetical protein